MQPQNLLFRNRCLMRCAYQYAPVGHCNFALDLRPNVNAGVRPMKVEIFDLADAIWP